VGGECAPPLRRLAIVEVAPVDVEVQTLGRIVDGLRWRRRRRRRRRRRPLLQLRGWRLRLLLRLRLRLLRRLLRLRLRLLRRLLRLRLRLRLRWRRLRRLWLLVRRLHLRPSLLLAMRLPARRRAIPVGGLGRRSSVSTRPLEG